MDADVVGAGFKPAPRKRPGFPGLLSSRNDANSVLGVFSRVFDLFANLLDVLAGAGDGIAGGQEREAEAQQQRGNQKTFHGEILLHGWGRRRPQPPGLGQRYLLDFSSTCSPTFLTSFPKPLTVLHADSMPIETQASSTSESVFFTAGSQEGRGQFSRWRGAAQRGESTSFSFVRGP